jgi:hypothetical protein
MGYVRSATAKELLSVTNIHFFDRFDCRSLIERAPLIADLRAAEPSNIVPPRYELGTPSRAREYQTDIERASALLCKVQPDLIAGEIVPVKEPELGRSRWPLVFTVCASGLFWIGIGWVFATIV